MKPAGQKARGPLPRGDRLRIAAAGAGQHDEAGQVVAFAAQAVVDPGAHRRAAADGRARVHERVGRIVVDLLGDHRLDDANVVGHLAVPGQEVADPLPALAVLSRTASSAPGTSSSLPCNCAIGWPLVNDSGIGLPSSSGQLGLVVERFQVRRSARHAEKDDALHARWKVRQTPKAAIARACAPRLIARSNRAADDLANQQHRQGEGTQSHARPREKRAALQPSESVTRVSDFHLLHSLGPRVSPATACMPPAAMLVSRHRFVHVENRPCDDHPRRDFGAVQLLGRRLQSNAYQSLGCRVMSVEVPPALRKKIDQQALLGFVRGPAYGLPVGELDAVFVRRSALLYDALGERTAPPRQTSGRSTRPKPPVECSSEDARPYIPRDWERRMP